MSETTDKKKPIGVNAMDVFRAMDTASKEVVRRAVGEDGYDNFLSRIGLNNDNLLSGGTYTFNLVTRNRTLLEGAYRGSWVVGRIVDSVANDMTRAGITLHTKKPFDLDIFKKAETRLQIWPSIGTNIKWGRLYGGAIGVLQIAGQDLATPLDPKTVAKGQFQGISIYDRWMLNPLMSPVIESGPEIGLPVYYQLVSTPQSYDPKSQPATGSLKVHYTRVIRYTGIDLPFFQAITEQMWGESVLERLWDRLISFDNATLSSAQLIDRANLRTVGIEGLREIIAAGGEAQKGLEAHFEMMRQMADNEGLTLLDKEDTFASTAYSFAGLSDMMLQFAQQLSGAAEIPLVVLFGQSPAGLQSTGETDVRIYYDNILAQQESKLRNPMSTLIKVMWQSVYGEATPDDLDFEFNPLWQMDSTDKANNAKTNTETIIGAKEAGLLPVDKAMQELKDSSGDTGLFGSISEEDIAEAALEMPPLPDEADEPEFGPLGPDGKPTPPPDKIKKPVPSLDQKFMNRVGRWIAGK